MYNVTLQHLKSIPFVQKACKTCVHTSVSNKNQPSSQTEGFMHGLVQKIFLETCDTPGIQKHVTVRNTMNDDMLRGGNIKGGTF